VDDRDGTVKKLPPPMYRAIIDEAHKNNLRVVAHIFDLADAKELLRSGIDGFAHGVRDKDIDDEFMTLIRQHPNVFVIRISPIAASPEDDGWLSETVPADEVKRSRDALAKRTAAQIKQQSDLFRRTGPEPREAERRGRDRLDSVPTLACRSAGRRTLSSPTW
jgi:imidazolonepropionase-like amidohydrolase